jgi:hypothetical protein
MLLCFIGDKLRMKLDMDSLIKIIIGAYFLFLLYQVLTKGLKGSLFGGRIEKTYGEVKLESKSTIGGNLKVHRINAGGNHLIGIEIVKKSPLGFQMVPALLTSSQAKELVLLLERATNET